MKTVLTDMKLDDNGVKRSLSNSTLKKDEHIYSEVRVPSKRENDAFNSSNIDWNTLYHNIDHEREDLEKYILVNDSFIQLYRQLIWRHQVKKLQELPKKHLSWIIHLIEISKFTQAGNQMLTLFNETNLIRAEGLDDILLSDFFEGNKSYLSTLKVLTMQLILKTRTTERYAESIIECFAHDSRYIFKDPHTKVHALVKLLLNFFTLLPEYKPLFGLKFLQYVAKFKLDFSIYIKNMSTEKFEKQISKILSKKASEPSMVYLSKFYTDYIQSNDNNMIRFDFALNQKTSFSTSYESIIQELKSKTMNKGNLKRILRPFLFLASLDHKASHLCDRAVLYVNKHIKELNENSVFFMLSYLSNVFLCFTDLKRYENVSAVFYNCFVVTKKSVFLKQAAVLNYRAYLFTSDVGSLLRRFERLIACSKDTDVQQTLFSYCCNIFMAFENKFIQQIWSLTKGCMIPCFRRMKLETFRIFKFSSEPMLCLLYSGSKLSTEFEWSHLCSILNGILNGTHNYSLDVNVRAQSWDSLSSYEVLLKSIHILNGEMCKGACLKLPMVCQVYVDKWIKKDSTDELTDLELNFLSIFVPYLHQNRLFNLAADVCYQLKVTKRYNTVIRKVNFWLLESYIGLQLREKATEEIRMSFEPVEEMFQRLDASQLDELYNQLCTAITIITYNNDAITFNTLISTVLVPFEKQLFDIQNSTKMPIKDYLKILLLNIKLTHCASQLHLAHNNIYASLKECKRSLKICRLLIKKQAVLSAQYRLELISMLDNMFDRIIHIYMRVGVFKDCAFFVKEYQDTIGALENATATFNVSACVHSYHKMLDDPELIAESLSKMNKSFNDVDGTANIDALSKFLFFNNEHQKLADSMQLYFGHDACASEFVQFWLLKIGQCPSINSSRKDLRSLLSFNNAKILFEEVRKQMERDSFFRSMGDSVMAAPACFENCQGIIHPKLDSDSCSQNIKCGDSPRSSSLTPRGKTFTHSFDRSSAINTLQRTLRFIEMIDVETLHSKEAAEIAALHALSLSLFLNMSIKSNPASRLMQHLKMKDYPRAMSLFYEKAFSDMGPEIYETFIPGIIDTDIAELSTPKNSLETLYTQFGQKWSHLSFSVIEIDVCPITADLLVTRFDTVRNRHLHLRLPLNRHNSRDLTEEVIDFQSLVAELDSIISANNLSTSLEVTASISTREQRKKWWEERHGLESRMEFLLSKIEDCWLCGFKGIFSPMIADSVSFKTFKDGVLSVLHTHLPSRKLNGKTDSFIKIDDMLIELFVSLDILNKPTNKAVNMMEDLLYFIFDVLLFHGEENAYDEIDISLMHVKLEELLQEYNESSVSRTTSLDHTFLILGNKCHSIPWESLNFLKNVSVSRVPSLERLDKLLERYGCLSPSVDISDNLSFVLNPGNDLSRSEMTFSSEFKAICACSNSKAFIGTAPTSDQFYRAVVDSNLFVYVGHSGGEQYVKLKELRKCSNLAPSLLLGCSSAHSKYCGAFESSGTIYSYLLGGCPMVVGNLWDVTDKDTDKLSIAIFESTGLFNNSQGMRKQPEEYLTVTQAIARSRSECNMKYLNGAAMVVYGLPMKFISETT